MINSLGSLATLLKVAQAAPSAAKLAGLVRRAMEGDEAAIAYLRSEGWAEALDLARPGAGEIGRQALGAVRDTIEMAVSAWQGDVIEGEYRELDGEPRVPWGGFIRRLLSEPSSSSIVLGPTGSGKTQLALRLAYRWYKQLGYRVEVVEMYGDDKPEWASTITVATLRRRMAQLQRYLESQADDDGDEDEDEEDDVGRIPPGMPPQNRVVIIDEAGMAIGSHPGDPGRKAALRALAQSRHLRYHVLYLGQWAGQIPLQLFGQSAVWVKKPGGRELFVDRQNHVVEDLWARAGNAFATVRGSPYWSAYPTEKAWAFCDAPVLNGKKGYVGMVPFGMAPTWDQEEDYGIDDEAET